MDSTPYLGLCVIFRDNLDTLPLLLESIRGHFDEYIFTDTGSEDGSRALVEKFLTEHRGQLTDFPWIGDFAAARNAGFDHSTARWRMYLDTDDQLINGEKIRATLLNLEAQQPQVEALFFTYDYDVLEELPQMRCCRWREGWRWLDAVHERLEFAYPDGAKLPEESFRHMAGMSVKHKPKTVEQKTAALRRNAVIARREYDKTTDPAYRARLGRTLAMEYKLDQKITEAVPWFADLYQHYSTYPEGRQAAADAAKAHLNMAEEAAKKKRAAEDEALAWAKKAGPSYEAIVHHARGEYAECLKANQRAAGRGPQTTHEGLIFEKGAAHVAAAASLFHMQVPNAKASAENLINQIPPEVRLDHAVAPHVSAVRASIDQITIVVPGTPQPFDENGSGGMLGGSEEAVVYLSRSLAQLGRMVRVFTPLPPQRVPGLDRFDVDWQPIDSFNPDKEAGTLVLWRAPRMLLDLMVQGGKNQRPFAGISQCYLWLHDTGLAIDPRVIPAISKGCNGAIVLSDFHEKALLKTGFSGKVTKLSNGILEQDFAPFIESPSFEIGKGRDPFRVVYSSCPSRGLVPLLEMWPEVQAAVPEAYLDIYYDWSMLEAFQPPAYARAVEALKTAQAKCPGKIVHHGGVDHATLHEALRGANVWAYSHFESTEVETFCISAIKALACGADVLTVPNGALPEVLAGDGELVTSADEFKERLIAKLKGPTWDTVRKVKAYRALSRFGWHQVAKKFSALWTIEGKRALSEAERIEAIKIPAPVPDPVAAPVTEVATVADREMHA